MTPRVEFLSSSLLHIRRASMARGKGGNAYYDDDDMDDGYDDWDYDEYAEEAPLPQACHREISLVIHVTREDVHRSL